MNKKSKIFFTVLIFLIIASVVLTYYKYVILQNFDVFTDEEIFNQELLAE